MSDRALSKDAMLDSLRDIRLPSDAAGGVLSDLLMTIGLAMLAAILIGSLLRLLMVRRASGIHSSLLQAVSELQGLSEPDKRVALLHILRKQDPERYSSIQPLLYRKDREIDVAALEAEVMRHV